MGIEEIHLIKCKVNGKWDIFINREFVGKGYTLSEIFKRREFIEVEDEKK